MRTEDAMVFVLWAAGGATAILLIVVALVQGLSPRSKLTLVDWRWRKLVSTILSSVSLLLFILSFDQLIRGNWQIDSRAYMQDKFLELKLGIGLERALACAPDRTTELCRMWRSIDIRYQMDFLRDGKRLNTLSDYEVKSIPNEQRLMIERSVDELNGIMPGASSRSLLKPETRISVAILATIALILAVSGSIGEAAFQYRQASRLKVANTPPTQSPVA